MFAYEQATDFIMLDGSYMQYVGTKLLVLSLIARITHSIITINIMKVLVLIVLISLAIYSYRVAFLRFLSNGVTNI